MKKAVWVLIIILLIAGGAVYYFLKPAALPVNTETRQSLTDVCIKLSQELLYKTTELPVKDTGECSQLGLQRFACEAAFRNDKEYLTSGQLEKDCAELAMSEAVLESNDKRNCKKLENPVLKKECLTMLS